LGDIGIQYREHYVVSAIVPVAGVSAAPTATARPQTDRPEPQPQAAPRPTAAKHVQPIVYYGGLEGMNATNLIVALQANGFVSDGYSARAIETGGTPPPAIVDRGA
jgi:hypothetical protein